MNLNRNPTTQQLAGIIAPHDDRAGDHLLWVTKNGDVKLSRLPRNSSLTEFEQSHPEIQLCCEPFQAGNEYVGPEAARDQEWLGDLLDRLKTLWQQVKGRSEIAHMERW